LDGQPDGLQADKKRVETFGAIAPQDGFASFRTSRLPQGRTPIANGVKMTENGKGDTPRPIVVDPETFKQNWEQTFPPPERGRIIESSGVEYGDDA
jgi:hypothetical protein